MFETMTPQCWVDSWDKALNGFQGLPEAWTTAGSSITASNGRSGPRGTVPETPQTQKLLPHLLTSAQEGVDIPLTAWRKLVVTDEVPRRLVAACCDLMNTAGQYGRHMAPNLAATGLAAFLIAAGRSLWSNTGSSSSTLLHSTAQQLEQGGLLQLLPRLFTHAATLLQSPEQELLTAENSTIEWSKTHSSWMFCLEQTMPPSVLATYVHMLLAVQFDLRRLWPEGPDCLYEKPGSGPVLVSAVHLDLAVLQYVSRSLDLLPEGTKTPPAALYPLLRLCTSGDTFSDISRWAHLGFGALTQPPGYVRPPPKGALESLVQSPYPVQLVVATLAQLMYQAVIQSTSGTAAAAPGSAAAGQGGRGTSKKTKGSSSGSSRRAAAAAGRSASSSGASGTNTKVEAVAAWQRACASAAHVPEAFSRLASSLGISPRASLWAACMSERMDDDTVMSACQVYVELQHCLFTLKQLRQYGPLELHLQLVAAWFQWLVQLPAASSTIKNTSRVLWFIEHLFMVLKFNTAQGRDAGLPWRELMESPFDVGAAPFVLTWVLPEVQELWEGDKMQQLLQALQLQALSDTGRLGAGAADKAYAFDRAAARGVSATLWAVTECHIAVLRQQQRVRGSGSLHASSSSSTSSSSSQAAPPSRATAATLRQAVQLLGLWEAYTRARAATATHSTLVPDEEGLVPFANHIGTDGLDSSFIVGAVLQGTAPGSSSQLRLFHMLCGLLMFSRVSTWLDQRLLWAVRPAQKALFLLLAAAQELEVPSDGAAGIDGASAAAAPEAAAAAQATAGVSAAADLNPLEQFWSEGAGAAAILWLRVLGLSSMQVAAQPVACAAALQEALRTVVQLLESDSFPAHLSAQGYDTQALLQRVQTAEQALGGLANGVQGGVATDTGVGAQLQKAGLVLTGLATRHACNSPGCSNVSGPSERLLVSGSSTMCAGCRRARYCSRECQKQHWKQHKPVCQALAAASAAVAAATTAPQEPLE